MRTIIRDNYDPQLGDYHERIIIDEARERRWLFDCDGVFMPFDEVEVVNERGDSIGKAISQKFFTDTVEDIESTADDLRRDLDDEVIARGAADDILQGEIDAIRNAPDVVDIVATYSDLEDYDTSTLTNRDVVRVLTDETHDDQSTYYRWDAENNTWVYIGAAGPYYTKSQTDTLLAGKQNTLTAGDNITIVGDTISATDTTYSDFTGTDGTADGTAGLVPAPATTDTNKFLKSDGTWSLVTNRNAIVNLTPTNVTTSTISVTADKTVSEIKALSDAGEEVLLKLEVPIAIGGFSAGTYYFQPVVISSAEVGAAANSPSGGEFFYAQSANDGYNATIYNMETRDNLTSDDQMSVFSPLSAYQGKVLNDKIEGRVKTNTGAPTTATTGTKGQLLEDITNGALYLCTAVIPGTAPDPDTYTWERVAVGATVSTISSQDWSNLWQ